MSHALEQKRRQLGLLFLIGMILGSGLMLWRTNIVNKELYSFFEQLQNKYTRLEMVDQALQQDYYDPQALKEGSGAMISEAIKAYVNGLGDPYTAYLDSEAFSGLQQELEGEGQIEGIGAVVGKKDYYIQVEEIIKGGPAFKAGIQPLDRIIMIGSGETKDLTTLEAVNQIRGKKGTQIELFIERIEKSGETSYFSTEVTRDIVDIPSVHGTILNYSGHQIGHLELSIFGDQTNKLLNHTITDFLEQNVEGIILDLRANGGGLLTAAVDVAGHFLEPESLIVQTKYRNYEDIQYTSKGFGELKDYPLVILINELSASASEILALALKELRTIQIIGMPSFGKGSIQTLLDFEDQTSLKYTIGQWFGPQGTSINKVGITPDIEIPFHFTGYLESKIDNQLEKAKEVLIEQLLSKE